MRTGQPQFVMVHHSLTKDGDTVSWGAIRKYHVQTMGWHDIGYHMGVELVDGHFEALLGRPEDEVAAACKEGHMNELALHVCFVGNFDDAPPSAALLEFGVRYVIRPWLTRYNITPERVVGHGEYAHYKTCPGRRFDIDLLRRMLS